MHTVTNIYDLVKGSVQKYLQNLNNYSSSEELLRLILEVENCRTGLKLSYVNDDSSRDGQYIHDKQIILLNKKINYRHRVMFTAFHELMHYLLENVFEDEYSLILEQISGLSRGQYNKYIENICNYGAGVLLIPDSVVQISRNTFNSGISFKKYVESCNAISSIPALFARLSFETNVSCIFVVLRNGRVEKDYDSNLLIPDENRFPLTTYIEYSFNSQSHEYPLKRFYSIPKNHLLNFNNMSLDCVLTNEKTYFPYSQSNREIPAWVTGYKSISDDRFFGILYPKMQNIISEDQGTLFG
jgi:hypothetical protein